MKHVVLAHLKPDSAAARKELRGQHLTYIDRHKESILAGGPSLSGGGEPLTMILFTQFTDRAEAEAFMAAEPYAASGRVFERVEIYPWSQVLPEPFEGALAGEISKQERSEASS